MPKTPVKLSFANPKPQNPKTPKPLALLISHLSFYIFQIITCLASVTKTKAVEEELEVYSLDYLEEERNRNLRERYGCVCLASTMQARQPFSNRFLEKKSSTLCQHKVSTSNHYQWKISSSMFGIWEAKKQFDSIGKTTTRTLTVSYM